MSQTLDRVCRDLAARIAQRPHADGMREARLLIDYVTGQPPSAQLAVGQETLCFEHISVLEALVARREAGEPLARVIGKAAFWDFEVGLNAATLIPRDDTGVLVEAALALLPEDSQAHIVDVGTGTGIILLALARERPHITGTGIDFATEAVTQAAANAVALGLHNRLCFRQGSWLDDLVDPLEMVVSNPPYIRVADMQNLTDEVRLHDPALALVAGEDGLDAYRALLPQAFSKLREDGHVLVEIGYDQAKAVHAIGQACGLMPVETRHDLSGHDRVAVFKR